MTGPEHYAESERLLKAAAGAPRDLMTGGIGSEGMYAMTSILVATAQVHATLALAAAHLLPQATISATVKR